MSLVGGKRFAANRHAEGEAELWLVSYADMMTLLFGFFVILFSFSQVDQERLSDFGKEIAEAFGSKHVEKQESEGGDMSEARKIRALQLLVAVLNLGEDVAQGVDKIERMASKAESKKGLANAIKSKMKTSDRRELEGVEVEDSDEMSIVRIGMQERLLFATGTDQLTPMAKNRLKAVASEISPHREVIAIEVIGHTDARSPKLGSPFATNLQLSAARASVVANELARNGLDGRALKAVGMGSSQPLFPETDGRGAPLPQNMDRNRRVEIVIHKSPAEGTAR